MVGAERRYDGPMGKSDRAFVFGILGLGCRLRVVDTILAQFDLVIGAPVTPA